MAWLVEDSWRLGPCVEGWHLRLLWGHMDMQRLGKGGRERQMLSERGDRAWDHDDGVGGLETHALLSSQEAGGPSVAIPGPSDWQSCAPSKGPRLKPGHHSQSCHALP